MVVKQYLYALLCDFSYCLSMVCGWACVRIFVLAMNLLHDLE